MASAPESAEARASREASAWLIELQEDPDDPMVRRRLGEWIAASSTNARAWTSVQALSRLARGMAPELSAEWRPALDQVRSAESLRGKLEAPRSPTRRWRIGAAALALAACLAFIAGPGLLIRLQADVQTETAESRVLGLPDGSQVTIAAGSAVAIDMAGKDRKVTLLNGEAFFQVTPDPSRPFRVVAGDVETSVVGTSFNVRRDAEGVAVSVEEGRVAVSAASKSELLGTGDAVWMSWRGEALRSNVPPQLVATWRQGQLILHDRPIGEAVNQLRRYYDGAIVVAGRALSARSVTGAYNLHDPEDALRGMARAHGAKVRRISPWLIVMSDD